jgi:hypothetical protein
MVDENVMVFVDVVPPVRLIALKEAGGALSTVPPLKLLVGVQLG